MTIPPLRERTEDIPLLAEQFLRRFSILNNKTIVRFSAEVYARFYAYRWPGNIRELENVVERAVVLCPGDEITASDLPVQITGPGLRDTADTPGGKTIVREAKADFERRYITDALARHHHQVSKAAQELGMHRSTLYRKIQQLGIEEPTGQMSQ
jgi:DNA-binding NtrC family response regulator